jgi:hypothetical protein
VSFPAPEHHYAVVEVLFQCSVRNARSSHEPLVPGRRAA